MSRFTHFLAIDWSGAKGMRHKGIALAIADACGGPPVLVKPPANGWAREEVLDLLTRELPDNTLVGLDLGIALPFGDCGAYFPGWDQSPPNARALWAFIDWICAEEPDLAASSFLSHPQASRYFRHGKGNEGDRFHGPNPIGREGRFRVAEIAQRAQKCRPVSNFNLVGAAQVGKSSLTGMRMLNRIAGRLPVWPIDPLPDSGSVIVEIYTALAAKEAAAKRNQGRGARTKLLTYADLNSALEALGSAPVDEVGEIDDHSSDALLTAAWLRAVHSEQQRWEPSALTREIAQTEGWTFGAL